MCIELHTVGTARMKLFGTLIAELWFRLEVEN
jgi:hypothetical protein